MAASVARRVASPTNTEPGSATDWIRLAVLTRSPATMPSPCAARFTVASPVRTPALARRPGAPTSAPSAETTSTRSIAARTARSASSSLATGVPHTAMRASPMNFSTVPPYREITVRQLSKYRDSRSRTSSESRDSESAVKPTRSANSTETRRRSVAGPASDTEAVANRDAEGVAARGEPHSPQNLLSPGLAAPQDGHVNASGRPHSLQNLRPDPFSVPQFEQIMRTPQT